MTFTASARTPIVLAIVIALATTPALGASEALLSLGILPDAVPDLPVALPNRMSSTGDSITRAFNACCWSFVDQLDRSWSTGSKSGDIVNSHYERIRAKNAAINGNNFNDAKSGAKMTDLNGQVTTATTTRNAEYITILMGANDVCTSTIAGMTPVATFQSQFQSAVNTIKTNKPNAVVYVLSIPNIYHLWESGSTSSAAKNAWKNYGICQSMLKDTNTEAQRQQVLQRNRDFNSVLASLTAQAGANFYWDGNATFNYDFQLGHLSTYDYFHPDLDGQAVLASVSWGVGPYLNLA